MIGGKRLVIGGGADGWIYAVDARTGEPVWRFQVSVQRPQQPAHGGRRHRVRRPQRGEPRRRAHGPRGGDRRQGHGRHHEDRRAVAGRRAHRGLRRAHRRRRAGSTSSTTPPTSTPSTRRRASPSGTTTSAPSAARRPTFADGKLFLTEEVGKVLIVRARGHRGQDPRHRAARRCPRAASPRSGARWRWPTAASTSRPRRASTASARRARRSRPCASKPAAAPERRPRRRREGRAPARRPRRGHRARPASRWPSRPGPSTTRARFLRKEKATWSLEGLAGEISPEGRLTTPAGATTRGKVKAAVGELSATTQVRVFAPLPWTFDFESGSVPRHWIGAGPRFKVDDLDGRQAPAEAAARVGPAARHRLHRSALALRTTRSRPTSWPPSRAAAWATSASSTRATPST